LEKGSKPLLHVIKSDINVLSYAVKVFRRRESDEATSSKQNTKRSQRAGRLIVNRTGQEDDVREASDFGKMLRGRDRVKRTSAIRVLFKRVKGDCFKGPITEGQDRVLEMKSYYVSGSVCSRGN